MRDPKKKKKHLEEEDLRLPPVVVRKPADSWSRRVSDALDEQKASGRDNRGLTPGKRTSLLGAGLSAWLARRKKK